MNRTIGPRYPWAMDIYRSNGILLKWPPLLAGAVPCCVPVVCALGPPCISTDRSDRIAPFPTVAEFAQAALTRHIMDALGSSYGCGIRNSGNSPSHRSQMTGRPGNLGCRAHQQPIQFATLTIRTNQCSAMPLTRTRNELTTIQIT
ncbi:MAG TPA: hypothetical protein PL010_01270 [Flavobacteriales bacterium]|jgi:hypothetical protein|nr:hypothetical protein [Flavobacteriales bacterium]HNE81683.1 hypothetical protein [Flavobacteriales bacterium]HNI03227.1 hypothetical protein [Flavobacteriales bacterium]HNM69075.1 hypothetical protein [Flavobacteriales bacterium]HNO05238.1 hypothetical protein [Flavobacteriales bacterium]